MKKETLDEIKSSIVSKRHEIGDFNKKVKRIKELEKNKIVKEYLSLTGIEPKKIEKIKKSQKSIVLSVSKSYLEQIKPEDTFGIYIYMGTYSYNTQFSSVKLAERVSYDSPYADYRVYWNIEQPDSIAVPINKCSEFEESNTVLEIDKISKEKFDEAQELFLYLCNEVNQEAACRVVLRKYKKLEK